MITCTLCHTTITDVYSAIDADWSPSFYYPDGSESATSICAACTAARCRVAEDGELELIPSQNPNEVIR